MFGGFFSILIDNVSYMFMTLLSLFHPCFFTFVAHDFSKSQGYSCARTFI